MKHDLKPFEHLILASIPLIPIITSTAIQYSGRITFPDQSVLFIRENYILGSELINYSYHWQTVDHQIIHRWDNAHPVPFETSPHHQHIGSEENVLPSEPMTLEKVLAHIATQLA
ncbi:MAG: hypothetical protein EAZ91_02930 [Cytophagales bacterium]|nr:MAG: hypothetical protein EAZ91_02930 [Cytophagales bacterium]